jgi:hypothetical protein
MVITIIIIRYTIIAKWGNKKRENEEPHKQKKNVQSEL